MMKKRMLRKALVARNREIQIRSYLERNPHCAGLPLYVVIESTDRCNLDCVMCPRSEMNRPLGSMEFDLFRDTIDQVRSAADFVYLHFFGEPLLNERIMDMIDYCGSKGITTAMSTNITLMNDDICLALLRSKLSFLVLSCEGFDGESYSRVRRGVPFGKVLENMESFKRLRGRLGAGGPKVVIQTILLPDMPEGYEDRYKRFWADYGADNVFVKGLFPWAYQSEKVNRYSLEGSPYPDRGSNVCTEPWRGLAVYWDGRVVPCCNDYSGKEVLGDLTRQTVADVWTGARYVDFRKMHASGNRGDSDLCRKCDFPVQEEKSCRLKSSLFRPSTSEMLYYGLDA